MNQYELIEFFNKRLSHSLPAAKECESYLLGESNDTSRIPSYQGRYLEFDLIPTLISHFNTECKEVAKRAYCLLAKISEKQLISRNSYEDHVYQTYFNVGMKKDFVARDISNRIGWRNNYLSLLTMAKSQMEGNRKELSGLSEAFAYYETMIDQEIRLSQNDSMYTFTLKALSSIWFANDNEKSAVYKDLFHSALFAAIKALYEDYEDKDNQISILFSPESIKLFDRIKKDDLRILNKTKLKQIILSICYLFQAESLLVRDALKLCFVMISPKEYVDILQKPVDTLYQLFEDINMPLESKIHLAASSNFIFRRTLYKQWFIESILLWSAKCLNECYKKDRTLFIRCYERFKPSFTEGSLRKDLATPPAGYKIEKQELVQPQIFPLLAILCREEHDSKFIKEAEHSQILKKAMYLLDGKHTANYANICCSILYDYSPDARSIYAYTFLAQLKEKAGNIILNNYLTAQKGFGIYSHEPDKNTVYSMFQKLANHIGVKPVLMAYAEKYPDSHYADFILFVKEHLSEAQEIFKEVREAQDDRILTYVQVFYKEDLLLSYEELGLVLDHRLKSVINFMEEFLSNQEEKVRVYVEKIAKGKNKNAKEAASRLLKLWDDEKIAEELAVISDVHALTSYLRERFDKGNRRKIPFADQLKIITVRLKGKEERAEHLLLEYYLSEYMLLKEPQKIRTCEKIREFLNENDLRKLLGEMYTKWLKEGADTKIKNLLIPYVISAGMGEITDFKKQMDLFTQNSRGVLAAFMVSALALNSSDISLLLIDQIAKKYKNKQVKAAAEATIEKLTSILGITKDALEDKIVPNLGFAKNREILFDYGSRTFKGLLSEKLDIILYDETGKVIKNLPKVATKDDKELAESATNTYKDLKKQLKTVIANQKMRLEDAVITGRAWIKEDWDHLFVDNPIMNGFATGLIWEEVNATGKILGTFRYMSDGSLNSCEEEEYILSEGSRILLLHPLDVSKELLDVWKTQLEDYEIVQPIKQLTMPIYTFTGDELEEKKIGRYKGKKVYFGTIRGVMDKYDWMRTSIIDGGGYVGYYYEDTTLGIGVQMSFDFLYVGMDSAEQVGIETIEFYKAKTITYGSYIYDDIDDKNLVLPKDVPAKFASFALMIGDLIAAKAL